MEVLNILLFKLGVCQRRFGSLEQRAQKFVITQNPNISHHHLHKKIITPHTPPRQYNIITLQPMSCSPFDGFRWFNCPFVLRRQRNDTIEFISLKPQIELYYDNEQREQVDIDAKMQKNFNMDDELGFTWHKSWIIPQLYIKVRDFQSNEFNAADLKCQITSGFPVKKNDTYYIQQVRLQGDTTKSLPNYEVRFSNLKFTTTSFNTDGSKFSLIFIVYLTQGNTKKILKSIISVPIYIDSRKEARAKKETVVRLQDAFPPEKMKEVIVVKKKEDEKVIENDFGSFQEYYTGKKSKIKHPFFVCYRFSSSFTLYYNTKQIKQSESMYYYLLLSIYDQKKNTILLYTPFLSNSLKKKTQAIFQNWQLSFTQLVFSKDNIPEYYQPIPPEQLYASYKQYYRKFAKMSHIRKNFGVFEEENEVIRCEIVVQKGGLPMIQEKGNLPKIQEGA